jgi:hypothetical protein
MDRTKSPACFYASLRKFCIFFLVFITTACTPLSLPKITITSTSTIDISTKILPTQTSTSTIQPSKGITPTEFPTLTFTPIPPTLTTAEVSQTEGATTLQAYIDSQLATLNVPTSTPTSCQGNHCMTTTPTRTPYRSPTITPTITPKIPSADIQINAPGPLSRVISPIHLEANAYTTANGTVRVELVGEDGQLIYRQLFRGNSDDTTFFALSLNIDFQIPGVSEAARLQVIVDDAYQRPVGESSVDLILLSLGQSTIYPPTDGLSSIVIRQPYYTQVIKGGKLHIEGLVRPLNNTPIFIELLTEQGGIVGSLQVNVSELPIGTYQPISVDLPYNITQTADIRLVISQRGDHIIGIAMLNSVLIWLEP